MIYSLRQFDTNSKILILALDLDSHLFLSNLNLKNITVITTSDLEHKYPALLKAKANRSKIEYFFTITPALIKYTEESIAKKGSLAIYLDADLYFFNNPEEVLNKMSKYSIGIIPHRFNEKIAKKMNQFGRYNVGMVIFRFDPEGNKVLDWWFNSCLEWCYDYVDQGKFADQGYLDSFEKISNNVLIINNLGANLAPWNVGNFEVSKKGSELYVEEYKLIFFHFHNLKIIFNKLLIPHLYYRADLIRIVKDCIYVPYLRTLLELSGAHNIPLNKALYVFSRRLKFWKKIFRFFIILLILLKKEYIRIPHRSIENNVKL